MRSMVRQCGRSNKASPDARTTGWRPRQQGVACTDHTASRRSRVGRPRRPWCTPGSRLSASSAPVSSSLPACTCGAAAAGTHPHAPQRRRQLDRQKDHQRRQKTAWFKASSKPPAAALPPQVALTAAVPMYSCSSPSSSLSRPAGAAACLEASRSATSRRSWRRDLSEGSGGEGEGTCLVEVGHP